MALDNNDIAALKEAFRQGAQLANTDRLGDRLDVNAQKSIIDDLLAPISNSIQGIANALKANATVLEQNNKRIDELFKDDSLKEFESRVKNIEKTGEALDKIIEDIKKREGAKAQALAIELKNRDIFTKVGLALEKGKLQREQDKEKHQKTFDRMLRHHQDGFDKFFNKLGLKTFNNPSNPNDLFSALDAKRKGGHESGLPLAGYFKLQGEALKQMLDPLNLVFNLMSNFKNQSISLMAELDTQTVAFYKATGQIGDYGDAIRGAWGNVRTANVSLADMSQQFIKLFDSVRTFTTLSQASQESLAEYGSLAERLGANIGKPFSFFMDSLKQSTSETKSSVASLLGIAKTTGESLKKVTDDFIAALPTIAVYGKQATAVFRDMFAVAKSLKIETKALLEISKGYDTFDEAATKVGRLNAILGGPYLNTLQMMQQSEGDRVKSLYQAVKATGMSWNALSKYQRLAIASAAGINDMNDANAIFSGSLADVAKYSRKAAMEQDELAERNKRAATLQQKWQNLLSQLSVVLMPVLDALHSIVSVLTDVMSLPVIKWILPIVAGFYLLKTAGVALFAPFKQLFGFFKGIVGKKGEGLPGALENTAAAANKANAPVAKAGGVFSKFGNVMMSIGRGVSASFTAIGQGISNFAGALAKNSGQIVIAAGAIATAILLIGGAIQLVIGLGKSLSSSPTEQLTKLTDSIGKSGPAFADNMKVTAESLGKLTENFNKVKTANVTSFVDLFDTLKKYSDSFNVEGIGFINAYSAFMGNIADITPEKVTNVSQITENIVKMSQDVQDGKSINLLLEKLTTLIGAGKSTAAASDNNTKIHLTIKLADGTSIRKELDNYGTIGI